MLLLDSGEASRPRLCGITDDEVVLLVRILALNYAVQAGEPQLVNLAPLRLNCIVDRAMAELFGKEILRAGSDTRLHVLSRKTQRLAFLVHSPQCDMGMRVFGVVVDNRHPVQGGLKIALHPSHEFPRVPLKVDSVSEFGGDDDFE